MRDILVVGILVWIVFDHFKTEGPAPATGNYAVSREDEGAGKRSSNCEEKIEIPQQQTAFCEAINSYRKLYFNEYHKKKYPEQKNNLEAIFNERSLKLREILGDGNIQGWKGVIRTITVEEGDGAWVEVNLPCNTRLESKDDLVIKVGTPLYESLTQFHDRAPITFSGNFLVASPGPQGQSSEQKHYQESSFTPGGSMDSPEFLFSFKQIAD
ncbi:MAG: hypothetical protein P4L42_02480 [Desulfocapsaceae bacterium]|nr:hypothetical protein [Desulfocapsaceae bacterium]